MEIPNILNLETHIIIAQILGFIGSPIGVYANGQNNRESLLKFNILAFSIVTVHYIILNTNNMAIALGFVYI